MMIEYFSHRSFITLICALFIIPTFSSTAFATKKRINIFSVKDIPLLSMNNKSFEIRGTVDLGGLSLKMGTNSVLHFFGGSFENGEIYGNNTRIVSPRCIIFKNCNFSGTWDVERTYPEWFGAVNDGISDCTFSIQSMFDFMRVADIYHCVFSPCDFNKGKCYMISRTIYIKKPVKIDGQAAYICTKSLITKGDDPTSKYYKNNGIAFYFSGKESGGSPRCTDISINMKVHAKPFYFYKMKNVMIHDCYVSTFTGDTNITNGIYTFWFAFHCNELSDAIFRNIHIDQPITSNKPNSSDGIHLSGKCHDILIDNVYGQSGDDFIALNTNENESGDIYNICIKNCLIGAKKPSISGIRIYGSSRLSHVPGEPQLKVSNLNIENCCITTSYMPCIFFTNSPLLRYDRESKKLSVDSVTIHGCKLSSQSSQKKHIGIWLGGVECNNLIIKDVCDMLKLGENNSLFCLEGYNDLKQVRIKNCRQKGMNFFRISFGDEGRLRIVNSKYKSIENGYLNIMSSRKNTILIENGMLR